MKKLLSIAALLLCLQSVFAQIKTVSNQIVCTGSDLLDGDTIKLNIYKYAIRKNGTAFGSTLKTVIKNHRFEFKWKSERKLQCLSLILPNNHYGIFSVFDLDYGVDLTIHIVDKKWTFTGKSANEADAQYTALMESCKRGAELKRRFAFTAEEVDRRFLREDSITQSAIAALENFKEKLHPEFYSYLRQRAIFEKYRYRYEDIKMHVGYFNVNNSKHEGLIRALNSYYASSPDVEVKNDPLFLTSYGWAEYLIYKHYVFNYILMGNYPKFSNVLRYFASSTNGILRDNILAYLVADNADRSADAGQSIDEVLPLVKNPDYNTLMRSIAARSDGAPMIDFILPDTNGIPVKLSDFYGKVAVLDFWFTGCGACLRNAPYMQAIEHYFEGKPVVFIGISCDKSMDEWKKSVASGEYVSPEILNLYTNGQGRNHDIFEKYKIIGWPTFMVISKDGRIYKPAGQPKIDDGKAFKELIERLL